MPLNPNAIQSRRYTLANILAGTLPNGSLSEGEIIFASDAPGVGFVWLGGALACFTFRALIDFTPGASPTTNLAIGCSLTRLGVGDYRVTWTGALLTANYVVIPAAAQAAGVPVVANEVAAGRTTGHCEVKFARQDTGALVDPDRASVIAFGT